MSQLSEQVERKFTHIYDASEWETDTDSGWQSLIDVKQTVEYDVWHLELENNTILDCADTHILFDENNNEVYVKDLRIGDLVLTNTGSVAVKSVSNTYVSENMYDLGVDSTDHSFYSNGILSHNTVTAAGYLLWYAMYVPDSTILVAANKFSGAQEIMQRVRYAYENCALHMKAGVTTYNKGSIEFDTGSRIVSQATTENTGRGMSISLLYCLDGDTTVKIRNKSTLIEEDISLSDLYTRLYNPIQTI